MSKGVIYCSTIVLARVKRFVLEKFQKSSKGFSYNSSRTYQVCSRIVPEQIFRTFMEQLQNTSQKMSHLTFYKCL